jgi:GAF domain-containing protein
VKGQVIGLLDVEHREVNRLTADDVAVLQLLANQVAVAIDNARLYGQAQKLAALQERQKLARELHDSVSQALYGIGLGTKTALQLVQTEGAAAGTDGGRREEEAGTGTGIHSVAGDQRAGRNARVDF